MATTIKKAPIDWVFDYYKLAADAWPTNAPTGTTVLVYDPVALTGVPYVTPDDGVTWIANSTNVVLDAADLAAITAALAAAGVGLDQAIPGVNTANSVNDILLDQIRPRLPAASTIATLADLISGAAVTFGAAAVAQLLAQAGLALSNDNLDHLLLLDGATNKYPEQAATDSILAKMLVKADPAVLSQYDNSTDSQEAIADAVATLLGVANTINGAKIAYLGTVSNIDGTPTHFHASDLIGAVGDSYFKNWHIYINWKFGGAGTAPQNESQICTTYTNADGGFTSAAFTVAPAIGDKIMLIHPSLASTLNMNNKLGAYTGDGGAGADDSVKAELDLVKTQTDKIADATYGLSALHTEVAKETTLGGLVTTIGTPLTSSDIQAAARLADAEVAARRQVGKPQIFQKSITSAANTNGLVTIATITTAACLIKSIVVKAVTAVQTDLTSAAVKGGTSQAVTFLSAVDAAKVNITAIDQQVWWQGAVELAATKTIVMDVEGTGATAVNLLVTIEFEAAVDTGYLE
ncbi:MAG: hypothetical protein MUP81_05375 [Dehalococcoidia bacterium]|nr:hypothetical protein [Dehalococcoidia bacterium]